MERRPRLGRAFQAVQAVHGERKLAVDRPMALPADPTAAAAAPAAAAAAAASRVDDHERGQLSG